MYKNLEKNIKEKKILIPQNQFLQIVHLNILVNGVVYCTELLYESTIRGSVRVIGRKTYYTIPPYISRKFCIE